MRQLRKALLVTSLGFAAATLVPAVPVGALAPGCEQVGSTRNADGSHVIWNPIRSNETGGDVGCVGTTHRNGGAEFLGAVVVDGWSYTVKDSGGRSSGDRVVVEFEHESGADLTYMLRRGRLVIG